MDVRRVAAALGGLYFIWGSTFVAVMIGIRSIPPLALTSLRYGIAGALVLVWARRKEGPLRPSGRQLLDAALVGFGLLVVGTGTIAWAEQRIPSGLAALLVATVPLWTVLLERTVHGVRVGLTTMLGLVAGLIGVALLLQGGRAVNLVAAGAVIVASLGWAGASLYARRTTLVARPLTSAGLQMVTAAGLLSVASGASGELGRIRPEGISVASAGAFVYLVVVGSIVGYLSFTWLNGNAPPTLVSTYAYVNPAVAILLGWLLLGEAIGGRTVLSGAAILSSVVLIVTARSARARASVLRFPARVREAAFSRAA
jgi:drug/metabolite transporter (DMT)-like permease